MNDSNIKVDVDSKILNFKKLHSGNRPKLAVFGLGAFGKALARCAVASGCHVTLFSRSQKDLAHLAASDPLQLCPFHLIYGDFTFTENFDLFLFVLPTQSLREVATWVARSLPASSEVYNFVSAAKGIEQKTLLLPSQILEGIFGSRISVGALSGPSFALELDQGKPTAVVIASKDQKLCYKTQDILHRSHFRVYNSTDVVGVELGGALKNIIAMVAGGVDEMAIGNNARAAVMTRGLQEMAQLGFALGADPLTFLGLSGLGDLILTCTGTLSRNRTFGMHLAKGQNPKEIQEKLGQVVEGYHTSVSAYQLVVKYELDAPIFKTVYKVLYEELPIQKAVYALLEREHKGEFDWIQK